jgi:hypothetical protein
MLTLPHCALATDHAQSCASLVHPEELRAVTRSQYGLSEDKFVYCNFGQSAKVGRLFGQYSHFVVHILLIIRCFDTTNRLTLTSFVFG